MAFTAESANRRIRNSRADGVTAARAALTHKRRQETALEKALLALASLKMYSGHDRADVTPEEAEFDSEFRTLVLEEPIDFNALALLLERYSPVTKDDTVVAEFAQDSILGDDTEAETGDDTEAETGDDTEDPIVRSKRRPKADVPV